MKYDLHVHSRYSDGELTPKELCVLALAKGLDGFALTDHDTIKGWREIPDLIEEYKINIVPAVEISTEKDEKDVHILAYGLDPHCPEVSKLLDKLQQSRIGRVRAMVENLNDIGVNITASQVYQIAEEASPGRPHVAKALIAQGYVETIYQAFDRYIGRGCPGYAPREKLSPLRCIETVRADGGFPVLAHPGLDQAYKLIPKLAEAGLWGVEVYHSIHSPGQEKKFKALAQEYNLKITGGSDFHSLTDGKHGNLGSKFININTLESFFQDNGGKQ